MRVGSPPMNMSQLRPRVESPAASFARVYSWPMISTSGP